MHWWQSAFSHSPSSSAKRRSADDSFINNRNNNHASDAVSFFSRVHGFSFGSHQRRCLTRARKLRHLTDEDVGQASGRSTVTPQPLPVPDLAVLFKRDARREPASNQASKYVLPSPKDAPKQAGEKRRISDANRRDLNGNRCIVSSDRIRETENTETQFFHKSPQGQNSAGNLRHRWKHNDTFSAPTSPTSSAAVNPPTSMADMFTSYNISPPGFQVWSAPEMAPLDLTLGAVNPCQMVHERHTYSVDSSPLHSPRQSTGVKSFITSNSTLHKNSPVDNSMGRRDSNAQATVATVHPLPLPPGAAMPPPTSPSSQINSKPDPVPRSQRQSRWQKGKLIGRGTFGSVYVGSNRETGALCAMKEVELLPDDPKSAECIKQLEQEINVLSQLKHPNIVQYYGSEIVGDRFYIYLEYVHPGSINKYVRDHCGGMTESIVRNFTRHIVSGLAYLHSTKTIHRDIKGANLLVDANGVVKLADFGMAKHLNGQAGHLSLKGSPYWMAPELLQCGMQKDASPDLALAVDIWSLGCTIIEMMNGKPPWSEYEGPAALFRVMKETPPIPETMSPEGKDFLRCCFIRNPAERPTATMLLEHRFLNNSNPLDVPSCTNLLYGMTLMDKKGQHPRERFGQKLERLSVPTVTTTSNGKLRNNSDLIQSSFSPVRMGNDLILKLPT